MRRLPPRCTHCSKEVIAAGQFVSGRWFCTRACLLAYQERLLNGQQPWWVDDRHTDEGVA